MIIKLTSCCGCNIRIYDINEILNYKDQNFNLILKGDYTITLKKVEKNPLHPLRTKKVRKGTEQVKSENILVSSIKFDKNVDEYGLMFSKNDTEDKNMTIGKFIEMNRNQKFIVDPSVSKFIHYNHLEHERYFYCPSIQKNTLFDEIDDGGWITTSLSTTDASNTQTKLYKI